MSLVHTSQYAEEPAADTDVVSFFDYLGLMLEAEQGEWVDPLDMNVMPESVCPIQSAEPATAKPVTDAAEPLEGRQ